MDYLDWLQRLSLICKEKKNRHIQFLCHQLPVQSLAVCMTLKTPKNNSQTLSPYQSALDEFSNEDICSGASKRYSNMSKSAVNSPNPESSCGWSAISAADKAKRVIEAYGGKEKFIAEMRRTYHPDQ